MLQLLNILFGQALAAPDKLSKYRDKQICVHKKKYSITQRSNIYPFSVADTIKLVSFRNYKNITL